MDAGKINLGGEKDLNEHVSPEIAVSCARSVLDRCLYSKSGPRVTCSPSGKLRGDIRGDILGDPFEWSYSPRARRLLWDKMRKVYLVSKSTLT